MRAGPEADASARQDEPEHRQSGRARARTKAAGAWLRSLASFRAGTKLCPLHLMGRTGGAEMQNPSEEEIRARAHELWEQAGKPEGREDEFWLLAEKDLSERSRDQPESKIVPG